MVEKDERDTSLSLSFIEEYRRYRSALHEREREIYRAINAAWAEYQIGNDEQLYRDNVARFVSSFSSLGVVMASYRAKPLGTELMAAERLAANGHDVAFLPTENGYRKSRISHSQPIKTGL